MKAEVGSGRGAAVGDGRVHIANKVLKLDIKYGAQDMEE